MSAPEAEAVLGRLVAHRSVAGGPNEGLIEEIAALLVDAGAVVDLHEGTRPDTRVLHAVLGPADAEGGIMLAAHGDVVDVEGQSWSADPFELRREEGRLYARGSADMKGFIAAALSAVARADAGSMRAPLHLAVSHDEEHACAGIGPLIQALEGGAIPAPLAGVVVGEPTGLRVVDRHKGKAALRLTLHGRAAHSATPAAGVNAVRWSARLIEALERLELELRTEAHDRSFSVPHATIGIGPIAGGVAVNIVPDACRLDVEARVLPDQDVDAVVGRIGEVAARIGADMACHAPEARVDVERLAGYPPLAPTDDAAFATRVAALARGSSGGAVDFGTEAGIYRQRLGLPVVVCGPGSMAQGHTPDEFIEADQLAAGEAFVSRVIAHLAGA
ncbi:acetylornithine deacetylase [Thermoleophilia bacterium SCSIO 60948]|nr:acetylornithine deacetylase [Thermoleophilia bacterium SCSIO 60948]